MKLAERLLLLFEMSYEEAKKLLGIKDNDDVQSAYKAMAKKHHPDKGGSVEMMQKINQAYDLLKDNKDGKLSFQDAKNNAYKTRQENYAKLERMTKDLVSKIEKALPLYSKHFEDFLNLKEPEINVNLKPPATAWGYDLSEIKIKFYSEDDKTYISLDINIWADSNKGGLTLNSENEYVINYNTFLYHNKKTHNMVKSRTSTWGKSSGEVLEPEKVFPKKKLQTILKKETKKISKKDFEAAILIELKKYDAKYERYASAFVLHKPIEDNIVMVLSRTVYNRQAAWHVMFKRKTDRGLSAAILTKGAGGSLPDHIKSTTFTIPENIKGLDLLLEFVKDVYNNKTVDKEYFKDSFIDE
jgi:curved DNA-binding protein CbpA